MNITLPKAIIFGPGTTIPEVDASRGEVLWVTGGTYAVADRRVWEGYTYECVKAVSGAPVNTYPPSSTKAADYWKKDERAPTNRMAPFDEYLFTKARALGSLTYELIGVFVDALDVYGIEGDAVDVTVTAGPGGENLIEPIHMDLWQQAFGEFEYLFGDLQRGTHFTLGNIPIHPDARIKITVRRNNPDVEAAVGFIGVGNKKAFLFPGESFSGAEYGAEVSIKDYSYTEDYPDGTYKTVEGRKAVVITLSCVIDADHAPAAKDLLMQVAGKAVAIEVSDLPKYGHLATVGKVTGTVRTTDWRTARIEAQIKGNV